MKSGKKGNRKAAASAAAHAASKRKTSAIEISAENESRVRDALKVCSSHLPAANYVILGIQYCFYGRIL